uniref:Uncharacterized protein n=1 Tax=Podoviridae sp. ct5cR14 TaxID=2825220 RepID=A0A8S5PS47_9CAUD|nr:MAG TPA: hypothetical protein [Podoviridae sp. ct5cR14]
MNAEGNQGAIHHPPRLYRCRSTEVAVFIIFILLPPPFLKEIANIDILVCFIQITFAMR